MAAYAFDNLSLDELIELLLVNKTTEYIMLMKGKKADGTRLKDLKLELEKLHAVIAERKLPDQ
jgi:hypothetical protein